MRTKKITKAIGTVVIVLISAVNVYLVNDIRITRNELSLLTIENIAETQEVQSSEALLINKGSLYIWGQTTYYGTGYDPYGTKKKMTITHIYYACDGKTDSQCTPHTKIHYVYN